MAFKKRIQPKRKLRRRNQLRKPKKQVIKNVQFKTEYKDRVSPISAYTIAGNPESWDSSKLPLDSEVLFPYALFNYFQQGTANGEIDGNQINPRYLSMKCELDFSKLPTLVRPSGSAAVNLHQNYHIVLRQCLILEDLSCFLGENAWLNVRSGRTLPAFNGLTGDANNPIPLELMKKIVNKALNRQKVRSEFLTYQRRQDSKVRILKKIFVKGNINSRLNLANDSVTKVEVSSTGSGESTIVRKTLPTPNQHFRFDWKMPKSKIQLQPVIGTTTGDPPTTELVGFWPGKMWIPCVMVSCERDEPDHDISDHPLQVSQISHFTYTDN